MSALSHLAAMDEQEATDRFEKLMGGPRNAFALLHLYRECRSSLMGYRVTSRKDNFRKRAAEKGYTSEQIEALLDLQ